MTASRRYRVILTRDARSDLVASAAYLAAKRGRDAGEALIDAVLERIESLENFPLRGPRPKELLSSTEPTVRQTVLGKLRIIYDVDEDQVVVLLIADGRRDMQALLTARLLARPLG